MKTAALSFGRWFFLGAILFVIGALTVAGAGRRRGSKAYGWRIALWALALSMMGGGTVLAAPQVKSPDAAAIDNTGAAEIGLGDEIVPKCYKPMPEEEEPKPPPTLCYRTMPNPDPNGDPPADPPVDGDDSEGDEDEGAGDKPKPPVVMPSCYEAMPEPSPPPVQPTCYAPMPTCYKPMPPDPPEEPES